LSLPPLRGALLLLLLLLIARDDCQPDANDDDRVADPVDPADPADRN